MQTTLALLREQPSKFNYEPKRKAPSAKPDDKSQGFSLLLWSLRLR